MSSGECLLNEIMDVFPVDKQKDVHVGLSCRRCTTSNSHCHDDVDDDDSDDDSDDDHSSKSINFESNLKLAAIAIAVGEIDSPTQAHVDSSTSVSTQSSSTCGSASTPMCNLKHVQFADERRHSSFLPGQCHTVIAHLPLAHELDSELRNTLWWRTQDYETFQSTAKCIAGEVAQQPVLKSGLEEAYRRAEVISRKVDSVEDVEPYLHTMVFKSGLALWCAHGHSRRGLERSGAFAQATRRLDRLKQQHRVVIEASKKWRNHAHSSSRSTTIATSSSTSTVPDATTAATTTTTTTSTEMLIMDEDDLRIVSEQGSKIARLMARAMGEADAAAVQMQESTFMRRWSDFGAMTSMGMSSSSIGNPLRAPSRESMKPVRAGSLPQVLGNWSG